MVDEKDIEILKILENNARVPLTRIATKLGISDVAVRKRLRKLEEEGVIKSYKVVFDHSKLGYRARAIVGFDLAPEKLLVTVKELAERPEVKWIAITSGDHMVLVEVWASDNDELSAFMKELSEKYGAERVKPSIIVEMVKE